MKREEWLVSEEPEKMLRFFPTYGHIVTPCGKTVYPLSDRKLRLFACALSRRRHPKGYWEGKKKEDMAIYAAAENMAEGSEPAIPHDFAYCQGLQALVKVSAMDAATAHIDFIGSEDKQGERVAATLLRDVVGDPFGPAEDPWNRFATNAYGAQPGLPPFYLVPKAPWLTDQVLSLAKVTYEERLPDGFLDPHRLLVLSDALEEAGCQEEKLLRPLRGENLILICPRCKKVPPDPINCNLTLKHWVKRDGPFPRGFWLVDAILGLG